jgi:16S rRNA G966 N2-methylase RsmD
LFPIASGQHFFGILTQRRAKTMAGEGSVKLKNMEIINHKIKNDFLNLARYNTNRLVGRNKMIFKNGLGMKIANYFMFFRNKLNVSNKPSTQDLFEDAKKIRRVFDGMMRIEKRKRDISIKDFYTISRFSAGSQGLGNFMPIVAKAIYEKYCPEDNANILDFSAGFGGRLVGAMSSKYNYNYVGVDPSTMAIEGLNKLIDFLKVRNRAKVIELPFKDSENELEDDYFDLCFTSPHYFKKEVYSGEETQSCNRYPEIEDWRKGFLEASFKIIQRKLKKGRLLLVNIANVKIKGKVYDLENLTIDTGKKVGFDYKGYKIMEMSRIPGLSRKFKNEKIFIFQNKL